jgi:hypothetical protein
MEKVRAKFVVQQVTQVNAPGAKTVENPEGKGSTYSVKLTAVFGGANESEENKAFWKYTPSGVVEFNTIRPEVGQFFELGDEYYLDFTKAPKTNP